MAFRHSDIYSARGLTAVFGEDPTRVPSNNGVLGILLDSNLAALPEMLAKTGDQLFRLDFKSLAYPQKGKDCYRPAAFNHLPVPDAEAVRNHILLAQLVFGSVGTDSVAKGTKEPCIVGRKVSVGAHLSRVRPTRAKTPRTKRRID
jgi:hypothetical protein